MVKIKHVFLNPETEAAKLLNVRYKRRVKLSDFSPIQPSSSYRRQTTLSSSLKSESQECDFLILCGNEKWGEFMGTYKFNWRGSELLILFFTGWAGVRWKPRAWSKPTGSGSCPLPEKHPTRKLCPWSFVFGLRAIGNDLERRPATAHPQPPWARNNPLASLQHWEKRLQGWRNIGESKGADKAHLTACSILTPALSAGAWGPPAPI